MASGARNVSGRGRRGFVVTLRPKIDKRSPFLRVVPTFDGSPGRFSKA
ncbi:hypothetical protein SAMCFNEI73_Ch0943 [Sinorhizobium americanum]|uniref:Uncharacterized protein n=1 Tax=Sinorhizobium americanum TaxID=194963 RepID=A0A1L3LJN5_9HYPH|nr:hypothetical protein SAMCFNEI73_Ch0943 [Sinorhizobium americanum]